MEKQYVDVITGSGKKAREQFDDMMDAASKHQFDCVLFWKLDRFRIGTCVRFDPVVVAKWLRTM